MDEQTEYQLRRKAMRLLLQGVKPSVVVSTVHRSRFWLAKWYNRFQDEGVRGLRSRSRRPRHTANQLSARSERLIVQTRRRLVKQKVGLIGAASIQRELQKLALGRALPSLSTIKRVLLRRDLVKHEHETTPAYFPMPREVLDESLHALDWTNRDLPGGVKVYAFHTLDLRTRACAQTITRDKRSATAMAHLKNTWNTLGIPHFLQLDNDAAFCGGYKSPRVFGPFVRLCLYVGVELIFLPVAEPIRNGEVERLNGLWAHAFWRRRRFRNFAHVQRASPDFVCWYKTQYVPPFLNGCTPAQAQRAHPRHVLKSRLLAHLPDPLPISAGRLHFIRRVDVDGAINLLNESWQVGRRWRDKYVWATLTTHSRRLDIWCLRSVQHDWQLLKTFDYDIPEVIARRKPEFTR
jgi:transposase InsO family protein